MKRSEFTIVKSDGVERIYRFLCLVDRDFTPELSSRIDIGKYAEKLAKNACNIFVLDSEKQDVAHIALYLNASEAFISSIAVLKSAQGKGLAKLLMNESLNEAKQSCSESISLEVDRNNLVAQSLYTTFGFLVTAETGLRTRQIKMKLVLNE